MVPLHCRLGSYLVQASALQLAMVQIGPVLGSDCVWPDFIWFSRGSYIVWI